jgi:hypothetical protein
VVVLSAAPCSASVNVFTVPNQDSSAAEVPLALQAAVVLASGCSSSSAVDSTNSSSSSGGGGNGNQTVDLQLVDPVGMVEPDADSFAVQVLLPGAAGAGGGAAGWSDVGVFTLHGGRLNVTLPLGARGGALLRATRQLPKPFVPLALESAVGGVQPSASALLTGRRQ